MTIYHWYSGEKYAGYECADEEYGDKLLFRKVELDINSWIPPRLKMGPGPRKKGDCHIYPGLIPPWIILSQRATLELEPFLKNAGDLLPVILEDRPDEPFFVFICRTVIDCLDTEKTTDVLTKPIFQDDIKLESQVFSIPQAHMRNYVSNLFVEKVVEAKLRGFSFTREYMDPNGIVT
ncbi:hypothetical protein SCOR_02055 [Sulfidibacter corallicola]|uniref:Uncharacterized protein n=1 Tax=Sulfidibacter corallicola TaxID=2818388 RepID=A0A8A4THL8_SULCO|nr:hypothetical protein [Sulfidibacter corallicola]QTD48694.1 hypothetical protein J3U87_24190 [Sulfidibacter corallicola]